MSGKTILLVEDNPSDIALTRRALEKASIRENLVVAEDGEEALNYLFARGPYSGRDLHQRPALVLLDIKLPGEDGLSILKHIRENPDTHRQPVVMLTSSTEECDIAASYDLGANSYIRKPVNFTDFLQAIQTIGSYWLAINEEPPRVAGHT